MSKDRPVFIPPRKRQTSKKSPATQNYIDHIVTRQSRTKLSPGLEDDLVNTSLLLKNKQPLPKLPNENDAAINLPKILSSVSNDNIYEHDDKEFQNIHLPNNKNVFSKNAKITKKHYESKIDGNLSKSDDCLNNTQPSASHKHSFERDLFMSKNSEPKLTKLDYEDLESGEFDATNQQSIIEKFNTRKSMSNYLTMSGTIQRGNKKVEMVDLQVNISREELDAINAITLSVETKKKENLFFVCNPTTGFHILILSILCLPFVTITTSFYSFYIGTLTWYNMFTYFNDEKSYYYKFLMPPILILAYPIGIIFCAIGLGLYAGAIQLSLQLSSWLNEIADIEKGFYGWLCGFIKLSDCSPYDVVILTEYHLPDDQNDINNVIDEQLL